MKLHEKILGIITVIVNIAYIIWLLFHVRGVTGSLLWLSEAMIFSLTILFVLNHWTSLKLDKTKKRPKGSLDIFLPVYNEPIAMYEHTLLAAVNIDYESKEIYVLDDGKRPAIRRLANKYGAHYISREKNNFAKAGNLNNAFTQSKGDYILVLDADQIVSKRVAKDLLAYFKEDPDLAMITTRQSFEVPDKDFNHDVLFYEHMQTGKNANNAAISCGSGVFYNRKVLQKIGGFSTWNIVEDLTTSYLFHANGFKTLYVNKAYTMGTAPMDLSTIYKQRGTWALDTFNLFFWFNPWTYKTHLNLRQKLHYLEIAWAYFVSAVAIPIVFLLPTITLAFDIHMITDETTYLLFRTPSLGLVLFFYYVLGGYTFSTGQFWAGLFSVYLKALYLSIFSVDVRYKVTKKLAGVGKRDISLILPHVLLISLSVAAVFYRIYFVDKGFTSFTAVNIIWMILMVFWFTPVIRKGLLLE